MTIGEQIKEFRKKAGLTQNQLATKCELAEITIRQYETNKRQPSLKQLKKISKALTMSLSDFLEDDLFDAATLPDIDEDKVLDQKVSEILNNKHLSDKEKRSQLQELEVKMGIMINIHEGNVYGVNLWLVKQYFKELNFDGQEKALEQVELLTKIPEYRKEPEE